MKAKILFPLVSLGLIVIMAIYFLINPSYEKSLEAKYYYEIGEYQKAYELANEAFSLDVYNRMASTIMAQSKTSMKYQKYVNQAKEYLREIDAIVSQDSISDAERAKIKMMCEIMIDSYVKLAPSVVTDKALVQEAAHYYQSFEKILEKVNY
jgi:tetratricopeptide (TPR) repeat protein